MRILYLLQIISPLVGGGEAFFNDIMKRMMEKGHEIDIICYNEKTPGLHTRDLMEKGAKIYSIKPEIQNNGSILLTYGQQAKYIVNAIRKGYQIIKENNVDIIHANTYTPIIPAVFLGKALRIPVISTVHHVTLGHWGLWSSQKGIPKITSLIGPIYERFILKLPVRTVHVVSDATRVDLYKINHKASIRVISNGLKIPNSPNENLRYEKVLLYIGRLVSTKNLGVVISAYKDLVLNIPDARLVIAGAGPLRTQLEQLVTTNGLDKNITFAGHVPEKVKHDLLCSCSGLILPSRLEGFGRVIIEAFAHSKPVLVSNISSLREIVADGIDGFIIPPDDVEAWTEKMKYILSNPDNCKTMGINGLKKLEHKYNLDLTSDELEDLYEDTLTNYHSN